MKNPPYLFTLVCQIEVRDQKTYRWKISRKTLNLFLVQKDDFVHPKFNKYQGSITILILEFFIQTEGSYDFLRIYEGLNGNTSPSHEYHGKNQGKKTIKWSYPFAAIYWRTDSGTNYRSMTGELTYENLQQITPIRLIK